MVLMVYDWEWCNMIKILQLKTVHLVYHIETKSNSSFTAGLWWIHILAECRGTSINSDSKACIQYRTTYSVFILLVSFYVNQDGTVEVCWAPKSYVPGMWSKCWCANNIILFLLSFDATGWTKWMASGL